MTVFSSEARGRVALDAGASAYMAKPFSLADFQALVDNLAGSAADGLRP